MQITDEMITALNDLRAWAGTVRYSKSATEDERRAQEALDLLDNADFFAVIDDAANEKETVAQFAAGAVDPAEWGDTTAEDMAAHQKEI